jgi:hypothetical protein
MNVGPEPSNEPAPVRQPRAGDVVRLTTRASVQFAGTCALVFRIIRVDPRQTYAGWVWLIGYSLDASGRAIERREVFVQTAGLIYVTTPRVPPAQ